MVVERRSLLVALTIAPLTLALRMRQQLLQWKLLKVLGTSSTGTSLQVRKVTTPIAAMILYKHPWHLLAMYMGKYAQKLDNHFQLHHATTIKSQIKNNNEIAQKLIKKLQ